MTDGELAAAFVVNGSDRAFHQLVDRHVSMVFGTCRRVIGNHQDAEDATQTVFATLAARAGELTRYRSLAGWLYTTAWNVSRRARCASATRIRYERRVGTSPNASATADSGLSEEEWVELYRSLRMLPPDYQHAIVLHHLEGMTVAQVAELTGWSEGTTASRLSRGRAMIRERLVRRGISLHTTTLMTLLAAEASAETRVPVFMTASNPLGAPTAAATAGTTGTTALVAKFGAGALTSCAGLSTKWAIAACITLSVGAGTAVAPHLVDLRSAPSKLATVIGMSSKVVSRTSGGSEAYDDGFYRSQGSGRSTASSTSIPEPNVLSVLALILFAARRPRRR
jgi:RNA polymerase sigma factor (sigma-70 family)